MLSEAKHLSAEEPWSVVQTPERKEASDLAKDPSLPLRVTRI